MHSLTRRGLPASGGQPEFRFFQIYEKNIPRSCSLTVPNFIEIDPMVWISIADIHIHIELYILDISSLPCLLVEGRAISSIM